MIELLQIQILRRDSDEDPDLGEESMELVSPYVSLLPSIEL